MVREVVSTYKLERAYRGSSYASLPFCRAWARGWDESSPVARKRSVFGAACQTHRADDEDACPDHLLTYAVSRPPFGIGSKGRIKQTG
jgi:hypothetical protein